MKKRKDIKRQKRITNIGGLAFLIWITILITVFKINGVLIGICIVISAGFYFHWRHKDKLLENQIKNGTRPNT